MNLDFATLDSLRSRHPAWRLLCSEHAPLVVSFLYRIFVAPNIRGMPAADLAETLEDELYALRQQLGEDTFPKPAIEYLNDWAAPDKGWLRKFYRQASDEPQFDLTPSTEKAIAWLVSLTDRPFVGTESRLLTLFALLEQIDAGAEADPERRIAELMKKREDIDAEISRINAGIVPLLDDTAIKDRFLQFQQLARELLADFREVEYNFRRLDRKVRERIALWDGGKGELLEEILGDRDAISSSDQGRSFRAFWDYLLSSRRQEELSALLERVLDLPAVAELKPEPRIRRVHYDWLEAGEHTQRTVAQLSQQLRRLLDDQTWLENRRIMDLLHGIEVEALALRDSPPPNLGMTVAEPAAGIELPMERPLFSCPVKTCISVSLLPEEDADIDPTALYEQTVVDKSRLTRHIRQALQEHSQVTLTELIASQPLHHGLAELVTYLQIGSDGEGDTFHATVVEDVSEPITWRSRNSEGETVEREARLPRVIFVRSR